MSADSGVQIEDGLTVIRPKLKAVKGHSLVWWFSGPETLGFPFRDWIDEATDFGDWPSFATAATARANELNALARRSAEAAGITSERIGPDDLLDVLIGGFLQGRAQILTISDRGTFQFMQPDHPIHFVGSGAGAARVVTDTIRQTNRAFERNARWLTIIMRLSISYGGKAGLREPIRLFRITSSSEPEDISDEKCKEAFRELS